MGEWKWAHLPNVVWNEIVVNWKQIEVKWDKEWVGGCRKITAKGDEIKGNRNGKLNYKRNDQMPRTTSQLGQIRYGAEKCIAFMEMVIYIHNQTGLCTYEPRRGGSGQLTLMALVNKSIELSVSTANWPQPKCHTKIVYQFCQSVNYVLCMSATNCQESIYLPVWSKRTPTKCSHLFLGATFNNSQSAR